MIVKRFGCTAIHNKSAIKMHHSFIHSFCKIIMLKIITYMSHTGQGDRQVDASQKVIYSI